MKEKLKEPKGITLIALIITIIILLILAMVSIGAIREEGIIEHAENAADTFNKAKDNQTEQISLMEQELNKYGNTQAETTNWWEITDIEKSQLYTEGISDPEIGIVAMDQERKKGAMLTKLFTEKDIFNIAVSTLSGPGMIIFFTSDEYVKDDVASDYHFEKGKWYLCTNGSEFNSNTVSEYTGPSPIQLSDFTDDQIYCRTYLERIINSFNNE